MRVIKGSTLRRSYVIVIKLPTQAQTDGAYFIAHRELILFLPSGRDHTHEAVAATL